MTTKLKANPNLTRTSARTFHGMQILPGNGQLIEEYLGLINQTIEFSLTRYPRVCAIRFDIRLPSRLAAFPDDFVRNFIKSLRAKVRADQNRKANNATRTYACYVDYVWTMEASQKMGGHHYHFVIFLNKDAYHTLGDMNREDGNMYARLVQALASALGISFQEAQSGINIPDNPIYYIDRNSPLFFDQKEALFRRASYFAKHRTKVFGERRRHFGCSRSSV